MKTTLKLSALLLIFAVTFSSCKKEDPPKTNTKIEKTKPWETSLGTASFATDTIWTIVSADGTIKQEWSDAVQTDFCSNKTAFSGWNSEAQSYDIDCRSNPGQKGDLFSWRAVAETEHICPVGWRVPDTADFRDLDLALGGNGVYSWDTTMTQVNKYLNTWGGAFGGLVYSTTGNLGSQGKSAFYWSKSERGLGTYCLELWSSGFVDTQGSAAGRGNGIVLRCVR
jgi:uncharacterized protein (TIGR02145 family)